MRADDLRDRIAYSEHGELPHVDLSPTERDALADLIEWANNAPHHDGCNARFNDRTNVAYYPCKCGRDAALAALDAGA